MRTAVPYERAGAGKIGLFDRSPPVLCTVITLTQAHSASMQRVRSKRSYSKLSRKVSKSTDCQSMYLVIASGTFIQKRCASTRHQQFENDLTDSKRPVGEIWSGEPWQAIRCLRCGSSSTQRSLCGQNNLVGRRGNRFYHGPRLQRPPFLTR